MCSFCLTTKLYIAPPRNGRGFYLPDGREKENFLYKRVDIELDETCHIEMDETDHGKLEKLAEKATSTFQCHAGEIIDMFCT